MRKPFDVLIVGLHYEKQSRDDKTAIELFFAGVRSWGAAIRRRLDNISTDKD